jgi:hypothetical protein
MQLVAKRPIQDGINWDAVGRVGFEKTVEALLHRVHADADDVFSPNDSGGDGGRDVLVDYSDRRVIYQLKFFPDGLSSNQQSRKTQIQRSFRAALTHKPQQWTLVVPCKMTESFRVFLGSLGKGNSVKIDWIDRPRLDSMLAAHTDLIHLLEKDDYLLRQVAAYSQEKAVLSGGAADLAERLDRLQATVDDLHPDWTLTFSKVGGQTVLVPTAKHPRAAAQTPVGMDVVFTFTDADTSLFSDFRKTVGFGGSAPVVVPASNIADIKWIGPEFLRPPGEIQHLSVQGSSMGNADGHACTIRLLNADNALISEHEARVLHGGRGALGYSVEVQFYQGVTLSFYLPADADDSASVDTVVHADRLNATQTRLSATLVLDLTRARKVVLDIDDLLSANLNLESSLPLWPDEYVTGIEAVRGAAEDLERIQTLTRSYFDMPAELSLADRIWLRSARILLEGGIAAIPKNQFSATAWPNLTVPDELTDGNQGAFIIYFDARKMDVLGHSVQFPPMFVYHPHVVIDGLKSAMDDATNGVENPRQFTVRSHTGQPFVVYAPELVTDYGRGVTPWDLPGVTEPPRTELVLPAEGL